MAKINIYFLRKKSFNVENSEIYGKSSILISLGSASPVCAMLDYSRPSLETDRIFRIYKKKYSISKIVSIVQNLMDVQALVQMLPGLVLCIEN